MSTFSGRLSQAFGLDSLTIVVLRCRAVKPWISFFSPVSTTVVV
jgi:hypothetical protein